VSENSQPTFAAAILASGGQDALARECDVPHKALVPLNGRKQIEYVIDALRECPAIAKLVIVAHDGGAAPYLRTDLPVIRPRGTNFVEGIKAAAEALAGFDYMLICTCDAPMLTCEAVTHFVQACRNRPTADLACSVVKASVVKSAFPEARRTIVRLVEESFVSGCLTAMSKAFIANNLSRVTECFAARKSKTALARLLGWRFLAKLLLRRLSLVAVIKRAEEILGCEALVVISPYPGVAFDVDKPSDLQTARQWVAGR